MTYDVGDVARLTATFKNALTGVLTNPTSVTLRVKAPGFAVVTYTYGVGSEIARDSTGVYRSDITLAASGRFRYRWAGTGALAAVEEGTLFVRRSNV